MDDLNRRLLHTKHPSLISIHFSKLAQSIKDKPDSSGEIEFLKEKCYNSDTNLGKVAIKTLLNLIQDDILKSDEILADFLSIITTSKCSTNVVFLINNLVLLKENLAVTNNFKCPYNLRLPQHPLITVLNEVPNCWSEIFLEIKQTYKYSNENIVIHCNELYSPFFIFVICNPGNHSFDLLKIKLWDFIINYIQSSHLIKNLLCWMQFTNPNTLNINSQLLIELVQIQLNDLPDKIDMNFLILLEISTLNQMIINDIDPREIISSIYSIVYNNDVLIIINVVLLILSKIIPICSCVFLTDLLQLCKLIILKCKTNNLILLSIKCSLLQWITNSSLLSLESLNLAKELHFIIDNCDEKSYKINDLLINNIEIFLLNNDINITLDLCCLLEKWQSNNDILQWLENLNNCPYHFIKNIRHFLYGFILMENVDIQIKAFDICFETSKIYKKMKFELLNILMYCLSNTNNTNFQLKLLKSLPDMGDYYDNIPKILAILQGLIKQSGVTQKLSINLMYKLWKIDNKIYPYLENLLTIPFELDDNNMEFFICRANILKNICNDKAEYHGKDMVAHLSKLLNDCCNGKNPIATSLAIDGITILCKNEIIDATTTWSTINPLLKNEKNNIIIKSLCNFIGTLSQLSYIDNCPDLISCIIEQLWTYILDNDNTDLIKESALTALSLFSLDKVSLFFPKDYIDDDYKGGPISGNIWLKFIQQQNFHIYTGFLIKLVKQEIYNYLNYIYHIKGPREPSSYNYLPSISIVKAIGDYVKFNCEKWKENDPEFYIECLKILSIKYKKPLPPLDWCFLQCLLYDKETKDYCICIASHQVIISGSARRLMENYIKAKSENLSDMDEILIIYNNLKNITNSIQPSILKPFLKNSIRTLIGNLTEENEKYLKLIITELGDILMNTEIQDVNKIVLTQVISDEILKADPLSKEFNILLNIVPYLTKQSINDISLPSIIADSSSKWFTKSIKIRGMAAINLISSPLDWLNVLIYIGHNMSRIDYDEFIKVFKAHRNATSSPSWLLDLIGQIQNLFTNHFELKKILLYCDMFILAVVIFSGYFSFSNSEISIQLFEYFPRALANLLDCEHWSICITQCLEWLYHMCNEKTLPINYRQLFRYALQSLKNENEFNKNMRWMKYMNTI